MKLGLSLIFSIYTFFTFSQNQQKIIAEINEIGENIKSQACAEGQLISNRAMNLFLADRVGYYLSDHENLTFCKNNIHVNSSTGIFAMTHSLFEPDPQKNDESVSTFNAIGLKTNVFNAFHAATNKEAFKNELGITFKKYWLSKPKITLNNCFEKEMMDAKRKSILKILSHEINLKSEEFSKTVSSEISDSIKKELNFHFFDTLKETYARKFAEIQFRELFETMRFKKIKINWTNLNIFLPVIRQRFTIAENLSSNFKVLKSFPAEISLSHTRFIETQNATKIYFNLRAGILLNNSVESQILTNLEINTYKNNGGKDAQFLEKKRLERAYIGDFQNFINPKISGQCVYFPPYNHFGISAKIEKNFGIFKATNGTIGIPIVFIDKQSQAQTNLEIQINYFDLGNSLFYSNNYKDKVSIGITWGQPIGRNVY